MFRGEEEHITEGANENLNDSAVGLRSLGAGTGRACKLPKSHIPICCARPQSISYPIVAHQSPRSLSTSANPPPPPATPPPQLGNSSDKQELSRSTYYKSIAALIVSGAGLWAYYQYETRRLEKQREEAKVKGVGKALIGGPFSLVDHEGRPVTDLDFRGKYMLLYFGYTFCPDVCPEELDKMAEIVESLKKQKGYAQETIVPIFISCDPKRDSIAAIKEYIHDFHPEFVGLIGTHAQIKRVAKAYRLYFSAPPRAVDDDEADYLVDHSIFFYLVNPDGQYIAHFGRTDDTNDVVNKIIENIDQRKGKAT
ncbi:SCO1/SenC-domain-containing protein [Phlyctochytrium arcticum]|nr:SCO1/SenC-domain-containing protein [Phlyctochytrium arcticum]